MVYRNGTYIAFYANNTKQPTESDIKYFNLLKAWKVRDEVDFQFIDSHKKTNDVRDSSKKETLKRALIYYSAHIIWNFCVKRRDNS